MLSLIQFFARKSTAIAYAGVQSVGPLRVGHTEQLHFPFSLSCIGEGNGNPLQCSCLENPGDGGAWWAAVYGIAQSRTQLKRLSSSSSLASIKKKKKILCSRPSEVIWTYFELHLGKKFPLQSKLLCLLPELPAFSGSGPSPG